MKWFLRNLYKHPLTSGMGGAIIVFVLVAHYMGVDKDTIATVVTALSVGSLVIAKDPIDK